MHTSSRVMYGAGGFMMHASNFIIITWLTKFYTPGPGKHLVDPTLFAYIFLLGRVVDAVADPIVGYWSDHHEGPKGRRIPFIRWGAPFLTLFLILAFTPPINSLSSINGYYLTCVLAGFFFFSTAVVTPYLSLIPELTDDPKERINLTTYQAVFILLATLYVVAVSGLLIQWMGYTYYILLSGVLVYITAILPLRVVQPKPYTRPSSHTSGITAIFRWTFSTLKNRSFRHILFSTSMFWFGLNLLMASVALWVVNVLGGKEADVALVMGPLIVSNLLGFPVFNKLAKRKGKYVAFVVMFVGMALVAPLWFFVERQTGTMPYLHAMGMSFLLGIPLAGFQVLPFAVLSDVVDDDEKEHGERREAIFFGMQAIAQKTMIGLSMIALQYMRIYLGEQIGLKIVGPIASVACIIGLLGFIRYPLREKHLSTASNP